MAFRMHAARPSGGRGRPGPASPAAGGGTGWCLLSHERKRERSERFRIVASDSAARSDGRASVRRCEHLSWTSDSATGAPRLAELGARAREEALLEHQVLAGLLRRELREKRLTR